MPTIPTARAAFLTVALPWLRVMTERLPEPEDAGFDPAAPLAIGLVCAAVAAALALVLGILVFVALKLERESSQRR